MEITVKKVNNGYIVILPKGTWVYCNDDSVGDNVANLVAAELIGAEPGDEYIINISKKNFPPIK